MGTPARRGTDRGMRSPSGWLRYSSWNTRDDDQPLRVWRGSGKLQRAPAEPRRAPRRPAMPRLPCLEYPESCAGPRRLPGSEDYTTLIPGIGRQSQVTLGKPSLTRGGPGSHGKTTRPNLFVFDVVPTTTIGQPLLTNRIASRLVDLLRVFYPHPRREFLPVPVRINTSATTPVHPRRPHRHPRRLPRTRPWRHSWKHPWRQTAHPRRHRTGRHHRRTPRAHRRQSRRWRAPGWGAPIA